VSEKIQWLQMAAQLSSQVSLGTKLKYGDEYVPSHDAPVPFLAGA
jgi:hypothetical protein